MFMEELQRPVRGTNPNPWAQQDFHKNLWFTCKEKQNTIVYWINNVFNVSLLPM